MNEIEAKIIEIDPEEVDRKVMENGGRKVFEGRIETIFYDFPDGRMEEKGVMRLRKSPGKAFITQKKDVSREGAKEMEELEVTIDSFEQADRILKGLGLEVVRKSSKKRTKYELKDAEVVVDSYSGIPPLLEVEAESREKIEDILETLGYSMEESVSWDASEVFEHYGKD